MTNDGYSENWWKELRTGPVQTSTPYNYNALLRDAGGQKLILLTSSTSNATYGVAVLASTIRADKAYGLVKSFQGGEVPMDHWYKVKLEVGLGGKIKLFSGWTS